MKSFDLIIEHGGKTKTRAVYNLLSGKNLVGTNVKCTTQVDLEFIKPLHFELLVYRTGKLTLIPLISGIHSKENSKKFVELEPNECYELEEKECFYIDKINQISIEERITKKTKDSSPVSKGSVVSSKSESIKPAGTKRKNPVVDSENSDSEEQMPSKKSSAQLSKDKQKGGKSSKSTLHESDSEEEQKDHLPTKTINKKGKKPIPDESYDESDNEEEEVQNAKAAASKVKQTQVKPKTSGKQKQLRVMLSNCELTADETFSMKQLGVVFVEDQNEDFDVLIMETFRRRAKLLIALNKKAKVLSKNWVLDCIDDSELIQDFQDYYLEIEKTDELKFSNFSLDEVQKEIQSKTDFQIFKNHFFILTSYYKHLQPDELRQIAEAGGATVISSTDKIVQKKGIKYFYIMEKHDYTKTSNKIKGVFYADPEYILLSTLKQKPQEQYIYK